MRDFFFHLLVAVFSGTVALLGASVKRNATLAADKHWLNPFMIAPEEVRKFVSMFLRVIGWLWFVGGIFGVAMHLLLAPVSLLH